MLGHPRLLILAATLLPQLLAHSQEATAPQKTSTFSAGAKLGYGYYTNAFNAANNLIDEQGNYTLRLKPNIDFTADAKLAKLELSGNGSFDFIFGKQTQTQLLIDANITGYGEINPHGSASMFASETITIDSTVEKIYVGSLTQLSQEAQFGFIVTPASGPVTVRAHAQITNESYLDIIEPAGGNTIDAASLGNQHYSVHGRVDYHASSNLSFYLHSNYGTWYGNGEFPVSVHPFRVDAGVTTQLTPTLSGDFNVGYARSFIRIIANNLLLDTASVPIFANANLDWKISSDSELSLTLSRLASPLPVYLDSYTNSAGLSFNQTFEKKFTLQVGPTFTWVEYGNKLNANASDRVTGTPRDDILFADNEEVTYNALSWLNCGLVHQGNYRWTSAASLDIKDNPNRRSGSSAANQLFLAYVGFSY